MDATTLLVTLLAALVHAGWNQLIAGSPDPEGRVGIAMVVGSLATAPVALVGFHWDAEVWPYVAASVAFELAYVVLLATAYRIAPMSTVYPIARGSAPVLVLLFGTALGIHVGWLPAVGAMLVVGGILLVGWPSSGTSPAGVLPALAVGACIAGYTLIDARGVEHASVAAYLVAVVGLTALLQVALVSRRRGLGPLVRAALSREEWWRTVLAGVGFFLSYGLVLAALRTAPAGLVSAVRETSVVMAVLLLAATGQEALRMRVLLGAGVVAVGVALVVV